MKSNKINIWILLGAICGLLAVLAGAAGDHLLRLTPQSSGFFAYQTAIQFNMWHALALLFIGGLLIRADQHPRMLLNTSGTLFLVGILLFSGGIYLKTYLAYKPIVYIVPFGGMALIVGWIVLIAAGVVFIRAK